MHIVWRHWTYFIREITCVLAGGSATVGSIVALLGVVELFTLLSCQVGLVVPGSNSVNLDFLYQLGASMGSCAMIMIIALGAKRWVLPILPYPET
jgi:hypothetical protein